MKDSFDSKAASSNPVMQMLEEEIKRMERQGLTDEQKMIRLIALTAK